jgi:hypothetical protein
LSISSKAVATNSDVGPTTCTPSSTLVVEKKTASCQFVTVTWDAGVVDIISGDEFTRDGEIFSRSEFNMKTNIQGRSHTGEELEGMILLAGGTLTAWPLRRNAEDVVDLDSKAI